MNKATLMKRLEGVADDAEIFMLPAPDASKYVQCETMKVTASDNVGVDEDGNEIPAGSILLYPA